MSHAGGRLRREQVTTGRLKELQNGLVLERRRVRQVDNDLCARKCSPSPVMVLTPEFGDAATTSCPFLRSLSTVFDPMSPLPPITTIFMPNLLVRSPKFGLFVLMLPASCDQLFRKLSRAEFI
jgi:hypothetical protein